MVPVCFTVKYEHIISPLMYDYFDEFHGQVSLHIVTVRERIFIYLHIGSCLRAYATLNGLAVSHDTPKIL